jgi:hypothetical protein
MTLTALPNTYVGQLNKKENMDKLIATSKDKDRNVKKLAAFTLWLINTLRPTPAWGKPKTNEMINGVIDKTKATIAGAKRNTTSAYAVANSLINKINWCSTQEARGGYPPNPGLPADLADFEKQLIDIVSANEEEELI